jgi:hypothetical protein
MWSVMRDPRVVLGSPKPSFLLCVALGWGDPSHNRASLSYLLGTSPWGSLATQFPSFASREGSAHGACLNLPRWTCDQLSSQVTSGAPVP